MRRIFALILSAALALGAGCLAEDARIVPIVPAYTAVPVNGGEALRATLMADPQQGVTMAVGGIFAQSPTVLGSDIPRESVTSVRFESNMLSVPADAWDVSAEGDGSVRAWFEDGALTIAGGGGVWANENCSGLFSGYTALERVDFNDSFHAEYARDMSRMFESCWALEALDLSSLRAPKAEDLSYMFSSCLALREIDLSNLDAGRVTSAEGMFLLDANLETANLSGLSLKRAESLESMFEGCSKLGEADLTGFRLPEGANLKRMFGSCAALKRVEIDADFAPGADATEMFLNCPAKLRVGGVDMSAEDWSNLSAYVGLRSGSHGDGVRWLQEQLESAGCEPGSVDGVFGRRTESALISWQEANGYDPTGILTEEQALAMMR